MEVDEVCARACVRALSSHLRDFLRPADWIALSLNPSDPLMENIASICKLTEDFRSPRHPPSRIFLSLFLIPVFGEP